MMKMKINAVKAITNVVIFLIILSVGFILGEVQLRIKNADQKNYSVEMWRYFKLLTRPSENADLGIEHVPGEKATLENVEIRINSLGLRGDEPDLNDHQRKRVLFLGSSQTLGWGVEESKTMTGWLSKSLGDKFQFLNVGVANYNARRYVALLDFKLRKLEPDYVVVHYFVNDAEDIKGNSRNFILRHSQLALLMHQVYSQLKNRISGRKSVTEFYHGIYEEGSSERNQMEKAMARLNQLAKEDHFKVILAMTPESHRIDPYPYDYIHTILKDIAEKYHWDYVDLKEPLSKVELEKLWVMPSDPHYNQLGHKIMAEAIQPYLK